MDKLYENYQQLKAQISAALSKFNRAEDSVNLIAVSKTRSADEIEALYRLGHRDFGENYVQELSEKFLDLKNRGCADIRWHFIGHLQTNKVKTITPFVHAIHSVDSIRLAQEISKRVTQPLRIFLNVNIDAELSKSGFPPEGTLQAAAEIQALPQIDLRGLMCIPRPSEPGEDLDRMRAPFSRLCLLEKQCRPHTQGELSMGMSEDFEFAIEEGSTAIRVGTRLFGSRK